MEVLFDAHRNWPGRQHPWVPSEEQPEAQYYDFRKHPEWIRERLEDFQPHDAFSAIQRYYDLLEWLNGPNSHLESNDSRFRLEIRNDDVAPGRDPATSIGLGFFFRELRKNTDTDQLARLCMAVKYHLKAESDLFNEGKVVLASLEVQFLGINGTRDEQLGKQLIILCYAYGESVEERMENMDTVVSFLGTSLKKVSAEVRDGWIDWNQIMSAPSAQK